MDRSIPSFRILVEIEKKSKWIQQFRKYLQKRDKSFFNKLFDAPKLWPNCLSNLSKPMVIESIIMSDLLYNFIMIKKIEKRSVDRLKRKDKGEHYQKQNFQSNLDEQLTEDEGEEENNENTIGGYNEIINNWKKFIECLSPDDRHTFVYMIRDCYNAYHESIDSSMEKKQRSNNNSCLNHSTPLFMALILYQQKQINLIKAKQWFLS